MLFDDDIDHIPTKKSKKVFTLHKCSICNKEFKDKSGLRNHQKIHIDTRTFACDQCDYAGKTSKYLYKHKETHGGKDLKCNVCNRGFKLQKTLANHMKVHTGEKPYRCEYCDKSFASSFTLTHHRYIHTNEKPYRCSFCPYACRDRSTLVKHQARHTGTSRDYKCKACEKRYTKKCELKEHVAKVHMRLDLNVIECNICNKKFKSNSVVNRHIKLVHNKINKAECELCGSVISNKYNMRAHLRTHVQLRPYRCHYSDCEKSYKDRSSLSKHLAVHAPKWECATCSRLFTRRSRMETHILRTHKREREVQCHHCGERFYSKNYIINHIKMKHLKITRKFKCDMCQFVTRNKPSLVMHIKYGHESESDRVCKLCSKTYKKHSYLKNHYWRTHNIKYKVCLRRQKKRVELKEDAEVENSELLAIIKQEPVDEETPVEQDDLNDDKEKIDIQSLPESVFEKFFEKTMKENYEADKLPYKKSTNVNLEHEKLVQKQITTLLVEARQKRRYIELERARRKYNRRISMALQARSNSERDKINIRFINKNNKATIVSASDKNIVGSQNNNDEENNDNMKNKNKTAINHLKNENDDENSIEVKNENDEENNFDDKFHKVDTINRKFKLNAFQCYECLQLFETKNDLIEHCKVHFDVCNNQMLKKCPICNYITDFSLTRHMKLQHRIDITNKYGKINERHNNINGSRYCYNVKSKNIEKIELIPSIKNFNREESRKLDKRKEDKDRVIAKTKLVRKGQEWVVEREVQDFNINEHILPKFDENEKFSIKIHKSTYNVLNKDKYLDNLKKLSFIAKKNGINMLYPCNHCKKICLNLSTLALHRHKHDKNPEPYKKIWTHKVGSKQKTKPKVIKVHVKNGVHRQEKPKPETNNHKCERELIEFYNNNVQGADIEFWQFLKIYNKMKKDNVDDFNQIFGHEIDKGLERDNNRKNYKSNTTFIRHIRLSKKEYLKRIALKNKLREKISRNNLANT